VSEKAGAVHKEVHLTAYDLLVSTNRETIGDGYRRLKEALERLFWDSDHDQHQNQE
jgi:plasmid replication initiation protein